jgi:GT2 family glycosyltransferase
MLNVSIVTYNHSYNDLKPTLDSLINTKVVSKIYLCDNSPTDKLEHELKDLSIDYVFNNMNLGFGAAHNIAIKKSIELGTKYHLVLNPDVYFDADVLEKLVEFMDNNPYVGNIMPKVLYPDGSIQYLCKLLPTPYDWIGRRFNPFKKMVEKRNENFELRFTGYNKTMNIPYSSGCFMFLRISALKEIGLFDEKIFMYCEDTDLSRRIHEKFKNIYYPEVTIYHEFQKGPHKNLKLLWYNIQSSIYYFNKWGWLFDKKRKLTNRKTIMELRNKSL